jgi:hypothetical protein
MKILDVAVEPGDTLLTFAGRVDFRVHLEDIEFAEIAQAVTRWRFGQIPADDAQLERIYGYHDKLERYLVDTLGKTQYLFRRALMLE